MKKLIAKIACAAVLVAPGFASAAHGINKYGDGQAATQLKSPVAMTQSTVSQSGVMIDTVASTGESERGVMLLAGLMLMLTIARRRRNF